jgi:hypothetical protein
VINAKLVVGKFRQISNRCVMSGRIVGHSLRIWRRGSFPGRLLPQISTLEKVENRGDVGLCEAVSH